MKKLIIFVVVLLGMVTSSWASSYSGDITGGAGLIGSDGWSDATLSWTVDNETDPNGYWTYAYTFTVDVKAISHVIIELSEDFSDDNIFGISTGFDPDAPKTYSPGTSNPEMPGNLFGIKWDTTGDPLSYEFRIVSNKAPMWGDFYSKDGKDSGDWVRAYNTQFGTDTGNPIDNGNNGGWVLVPDTVVPIPSAIWLLGSAFLGLVGFRRKRRR